MARSIEQGTLEGGQTEDCSRDEASMMSARKEEKKRKAYASQEATCIEEKVPN